MKRLLALFLCFCCLLTVSPALAAKKTKQKTDPRALALQQLDACAFGSEYGGSHPVAKWVNDIHVYFTGGYNKKDIQFFSKFIAKLNDKVPGLPRVSIVDTESEANVVCHFVNLKQMGSVFSNYTEGNWGYFSYSFNSAYEIDQAIFAIAKDKCNRKARNHLLMEEFIGLLGIGNDHMLDKKSILYQKWTTVQSLTEADWLMLRLFYDRRIRPGMSKSEALSIMYGIQ